MPSQASKSLGPKTADLVNLTMRGSPALTVSVASAFVPASELARVARARPLGPAALVQRSAPSGAVFLVSVEKAPV